MNHKTESTRLGRLLLILAMTIALVAGTALIGANGAKAAGSGSTQDTATSSDPVSKTVTDNEDGTYTVKLSAQGKSSSTSSSNTAEVVVVMDISGSMNNAIEPATYQKFTGTPDTSKDIYYGYVWGNYVKLNYDWNYGWYYQSGWSSPTSYTGDFYTQRTRLDVAKESTISLVKQLLANNTSAHSNAVTVKLVTFNKTASQATELNSSNYKTVINGLTATGGTNWEDGLTKARDELRNSTADNKNVIFVSDGNPTFWLNRNGSVGGTGYENDKNISNSYNQANPVAQDIVQNGINLYKVGVFGNVNRMQGLGTGTSNPTGSLQYYSATNQTQLEAAFANIINSITNSFTLDKIQFSDGITHLTSVQKLSTDASKVDFTYKKNDTKAESGTASGTIPAANYKDGTITWDPTANGAIPNNVTYSVECTIWPSKSAYQQVANAKNSGSDIDRNSNISKDGNDYYLNSNTSDSTVSYDEVHSTTSSDATVLSGVTKNGDSYSYNGTSLTSKDGKYQSADGNIVLEQDGKGWKLTVKTTKKLDSGKMKVEPAAINVTKNWNNVSDNDKPTSITVKAESTTSGDSTSYTKTIKPDSDGNWKGTIYVAPGLKRSTDNTVLNPSTTYKIEETGTDAGEYQTTYDPADQTYTPVNNGLTAAKPYDITITNTKIIKTGIHTENRAPFAAAGIGLGALAVVFVLRRRFVRR
jgi:hypothetical protein